MAYELAQERILLLHQIIALALLPQDQGQVVLRGGGALGGLGGLVADALCTTLVLRPRLCVRALDARKFQACSFGARIVLDVAGSYALGSGLEPNTGREDGRDATIELLGDLRSVSAAHAPRGCGYIPWCTPPDCLWHTSCSGCHPWCRS